VIGNGVGVRGVGSVRAAKPVISNPPAYDPTVEPTAKFAGDPTFLDSAYAQVQSDVGIVGTLALVASLIGLTLVLTQHLRHGNGEAAWAAFAVLIISVIDWIGRSSMASYTTGFLTMYILGVLIAASGTPARSP
jgi:hypothetical protein